VTTHIAPTRAARGEIAPLDRTVDPERLANYLEDAAHVPGGHAAAIAFPRTERDVAAILSAAAHVLPVGAQSSLTGGATPRGETVLSTVHLRGIELLDDGCVRVGAGVTIAEIDEWLAGMGQLYPPGPTWHGATIGGTVATNAAGPATFKHGTTRNWIDGLTVVLASGDVLDIRRGDTVADEEGHFEIQIGARTVRVPVPSYRMPRVSKLSAGYFAEPGMDLVDLFIGAEGTLGIVTAATLRVSRVRPATCLAFVTTRDREVSLQLVGRLRAAAQHTWRVQEPGGLDVSAIEHMDARSLQLLRDDGVDRRLGIALDPHAVMGLLIAIDLPADVDARQAYDALARGASATPAGERLDGLSVFGALLEEFDATEHTVIAAPGDTIGAQRLYALREAVPLAVNQRVGRAGRDVDPRIEKTAADVIVPFEQFGAMLDLYERELLRRGLDGAIWGHISDGNVHPNVIPRSFADVESGREAVLAFGREAIGLGGAPLAEHGVGRSAIKQQLLRDLYGEEGIEQMRRVKRALDPEWKLAPGVLFDR
jgi:D-lactate dehydrogenase (cytochrome)